MDTQTITGIGTVNVDLTEYTSTAVLNSYYDAVKNLQAVFTTTTPSETDYQTILKQIQALQTLSQGTITAVPTGDVTTPTAQYTTYLNTQMANALQNIMGSLSVVGVPPSGDIAQAITDASSTTNPTPPLNEQAQIVQNWQSLPVYGIDVASFLTQGLNVKQFDLATTDPKTGLPSSLVVQAFPTRSLQSALELEYVSFANQLISSKLGNLETGLTLSQQILGTLTNVQNSINQITVSPTQPPFKFPPADPLPGTAAYATLLSNMQNNVSNEPAVAAGGLSGGPANAFATELNRIWTANQSGASPPPSAADVAAYAVIVSVVNQGFMASPISFPLANDSSIPTTTLNFGIFGHAQYPNPAAALINLIPSVAVAAIADYDANPHNLVSITGTALNYNDPITFRNAYERASSAYFSALIPSALIPNVTAAAQNLQALKTTLLSEIQQVVAQNPGGANSAMAVGSFANTLFKVATDISTSFTGTKSDLSAVKQFILDGQDTTASTLGTTATQIPIQNDITNAISAAETLTTNQQEDVKRYMFIFQQFYQTTAAMLNALESALLKMARSMGR